MRRPTLAPYALQPVILRQPIDLRPGALHGRGGGGKGHDALVQSWSEGLRGARVRYTGSDKVYGDVVFQELGLDAKPRGGMMLKVKEVEVKGE